METSFLLCSATFWRPLAILAALIVGVSFGCSNTTHEVVGVELAGPRTNPPLPAGYAVVAKHLATGPEQRTAQKQEKSGAEIAAEMRTAIFELEQATSDDPEMRYALGEAIACHKEGADISDRIFEMQASLGELIYRGFKGFGAGISRNPYLILNQLEESLREAVTQEKLQKRIISVFHRSRAAALLLPQLAKKHAGPPVKSGQAVTVDFDEDPKGELDWISLTNTSGIELTHCTVLVTLLGKDGEKCTNIHYVEKWAPGEAVDISYFPGWECQGEMVGRATVKQPASLTFSIYCDQMTQENQKYEYRGAERDRDLENLLSDVQLSARYQPFVDGMLWDTACELTVSYKGCELIGEPTIEAVLYSGDQTYTENLLREVWKTDESLTIKFPTMKGKVDRYEVHLKFDDSQVSRSITGNP